MARRESLCDTVCTSVVRLCQETDDGYMLQARDYDLPALLAKWALKVQVFAT